MKQHKKNNASIQISIRFPKEDAQKLNAEAKKKNTTTASLIKAKVKKADRQENREEIMRLQVTLQNQLNRLAKRIEEMDNRRISDPELNHQLSFLETEVDDLWQILN